MNNLKLVADKIKKTKYNEYFGVYECFCGKQFEAKKSSINNGHTKSCGCLRDKLTKERFTTHGKSRTSEFHTWQQIIQRCTNPNNQRWEYYGGRGITVCDAWRTSFETFLSDMGLRPKGLSIDRIDNDKGYYKENCRWATSDVQNVNKRQRKSKNAT